MTPHLQEQSKQNNPQSNTATLNDPGETIVISGMSGLYPLSQNIKELSEILYNKTNPIRQTSRWKHTHPEDVNYIGEIQDLDLFDAQFFKIHYHLADNMEPMSRKVLEQAYQAVYDAGVNPEYLSGKKTGVYIALNFSETEKTCMALSYTKKGFRIAGCSRTMHANRISYWLNGKGPSHALDAACCGSAVALELAYLDMNSGRCDSAIVGGCNLCLHPQTSVHYGRVVPLCRDGKVKSFDENADGTVRSDVVNVLFLQKAKDALRVYAELVHVKAQYITQKEEYGAKFGFNPDHESSVNFINNFYKEVNISPNLVEYVEAFGSGVPDADKAELEIISEVFCKDRSDPLPIGSVMSNVGYGDNASGISGIIKVLLGYHYGQLAGNLHCKTPRQDVAAVRENQLSIVNDNQPFDRSFVAVNGTSLTGINSHVLLRGHYKPKDINRYKSYIPYVVPVSGRTESTVKKIFDDLTSRPIDPEELALLYNIHEEKIPGHLCRGFAVLGTNEPQKTVSLCEKIEYFDDVGKPLWFVYSGMGSQWPGMAAHLMQIPMFASSINRCHAALKPKGLDLINIITSTEKTMFNNILHSFVGIAAVQVALTDILKELGLVPDKIIGHSQGEMGCAYADGCFTVEEMMLAAYSRGFVSTNTPFRKGLMVAVGLGYKDIVTMCPPGIVVACRNGPESSTLSGPAELIEKFIAKLNSEGIFAKEVHSSNIAFHSEYIAEAGHLFLKGFKEIIKEPKLRTSRWISTSVPVDKWDEPEAKYSSPEYHTNNLLNPVLFEEALSMVPENAVLVEVAPHGLLQAILKRSLPVTCKNIPLTKRGHSDNLLFLLEALGKIYNQGYNLKMKNLYPRVEFPVSTGTPFLSHLVEWAHQEKWQVALYHSERRRDVASCGFPLSIYDDENRYLKGHVINGKTVYPFAGALVAAWDTLAMTLGATKKQLSVKFHEIFFYSQPVLHDQQELRLRVSINRGSGYFEVLNNCMKIVTGYINALSGTNLKQDLNVFVDTEKMVLTCENIYQLLSERNYSYRDDFCSIHRTNLPFTSAEIIWNHNWVTLIDGLMQLNTLRHQHCTVSQPSYINTIVIDIKNHFRTDIIQSKEHSLMTVYVSEMEDETRCGGIALRQIKFRDLLLSPNHKYTFKSSDIDKSLTKNINKEPQKNEYDITTRNTFDLEQNIRLKSDEIGDFNSLSWEEAPRVASGVNVTVHYAGISNDDVSIANGAVPCRQKTEIVTGSYGTDFSGIIKSTGERVMGLVNGGAICQHLSALPELLWPVPVHWSLEEAATVPLPYIHAFYCLGIKHRLLRSQNVLVIGGAGALGQAAISVALAHGCQVFTTVSDIRKKQFLIKMFPKLNAENIVDSDDSNFGDKVIMNTKGNGCDVVISCVKGSMRTEVLRCCNKYGVTFDTVQVRSQENYALGMAYLNNDKNYVAVNISSLFEVENHADIKKLQLLVSEGIKRGFVRPLTSVTYSPQDVARAFRLVARRRHRGRVVLDLRKPLPITQPRLICSSDQYHWVISDSEKFSLLWVEKLINCGARKVIICCLNMSILFDLKVRCWRKQGLKIEIPAENLFQIQNGKKITELLSNGKSLKAVEGVYIIIANDNVPKKLDTMAYNVETALRKFGPSSKYFVVISADKHIRNESCLNRIKDLQPVTFLHLPVLQQFHNENITCDMSKWRGATDVIEQALLSKQPVITAYADISTEPLAFRNIASLTGIDVSFESDGNLTLKELKVPTDQLQQISVYLRCRHNMHLNEEEILCLTVKQVQDLENLEETSFKLKEQKGLINFISIIDPDEVSAGAEMVFLPTRTFSECMANDEFDAREPFLCIVPGIEGNHQRFRTMCRRLKLNAVVLQSGLDSSNETIQEMAIRYAKVLLEKTKLNKNFYILGYESGVLVALEIAEILETHGLIGKVFCIGFLPDDYKVYIENQLNDIKTDKSLQDAVIEHVTSLVSRTTKTKNLVSVLEETLSWKNKITLYLHKQRDNIPYTLQYIQTIIEATYEMIRKTRSYSVKRRTLKSKIILLKPETDLAGSSSSHQLQSKQEIVIYELNTSLLQVCEDLRCAAIINKHLDKDILDAFEKRNTCDTCLFETDVYVS